METGVAILIAVVASIFSLSIGGILAPKPFVKRNRMMYLYLFMAMVAFLSVCSAALLLEEKWSQVSSIVGAVMVALFTVLASNEVAKNEANRKKADHLVMHRTIAVNRMLSDLNIAHGFVSQSRYLMELVLDAHTPAKSGNEEITNRFNALIARWPNIESAFRMKPDNDNVEFPEIHLKLYAMWPRCISFFEEFFLIQKSYNHQKDEVIAPKLDGLPLPLTTEILVENFKEYERYFFVHFFDNYPIACNAAERLLRQTLTYIKNNYESLILGEISTLVSDTYIKQKGWKTSMTSEDSSFDFATSWDEIKKYYLSMGLGTMR